MKIHVSDLEGVALDYAVAMARGYKVADMSGMSSRIFFVVPNHGYMPLDDFFPSSDWAQCGPLIDEYNIWLRGPVFDGDGCAADFGGDRTKRGFGPTPLTAVCRAFVSAKLGDEIEIPDELMEPRT